MWRLSSHSVEDRRKAPGLWARAELGQLERLVALHRALTLRGVPVLVTTYAQLLWQRRKFAARLAAFAPCAGPVDLDFVPVLGEDVFLVNHIKIEGSISSYAARFTAEKMGVDRESGRCAAPPHELYEDLAATGNASVLRAARLEDYISSQAEALS